MPGIEHTMPTAIEKLQHERENIPAWLANYDPESTNIVTAVVGFLQSKCVFHPGAGIAGHDVFAAFDAPQLAHCVVHVDPESEPQTVVDELIQRYGQEGYDEAYTLIDARTRGARQTAELLGLANENANAEDPPILGACWAVLERKSRSPDEHGPSRIAFLHVHGNAIWLFHNLWPTMGQPAPYGILLQVAGGDFLAQFGAGGELNNFAEENHRMPHWLLVGPPTMDAVSWSNYPPVNGEAVMGHHIAPWALFCWANLFLGNELRIAVREAMRLRPAKANSYIEILRKSDPGAADQELALWPEAGGDPFGA